MHNVICKLRPTLTGRGCNLSELQSFRRYKYYQLLASSYPRTKRCFFEEKRNIGEQYKKKTERKIELQHERSVQTRTKLMKNFEQAHNQRQIKNGQNIMFRLHEMTLNCNIIYETDSNSCSLSLQRG